MKDEPEPSRPSVPPAFLAFSQELEGDVTLQFLVETGGDVNVKDNAGWTPLFYAVHYNNTPAVTQLIRERADVNVSSCNPQ